MRFRFASVVAWQSVNDEAFVLDLSSRRAIGLNRTASFIWERIESRNVSEISTDFSRAFDVDLETARSDVSIFLADMRDRGLIERLE